MLLARHRRMFYEFYCKHQPAWVSTLSGVSREISNWNMKNKNCIVSYCTRNFKACHGNTRHGNHHNSHVIFCRHPLTFVMISFSHLTSRQYLVNRCYISQYDRCKILRWTKAKHAKLMVTMKYNTAMYSTSSHSHFSHWPFHCSLKEKSIIAKYLQYR